MLNQGQLDKIKETVSDFFEKMTMPASSVQVGLSSVKKDAEDLLPEQIDVVELEIKSDEPQILIGQQGQTLFEIQRLLKMILNKKVGEIFYFNLDINDYKKQKVEYLRDLAKDLADHVALTGVEKKLSPMSSYERRIVHAELSSRVDVITESHGEGLDRHIIIKLK